MAQPRAPALPQPGDKIAGKYELLRVIGEGGMGVVYEALHLRLQQRVAIKMLQPRVVRMPDVVARFEREARAACRLRSRHAVRVLDVDHTPDGVAYMVMELMEGRDLAGELARRARLPVAEAVDLILQASAAMAEAHASGVIHRDLKPSNLFLAEEGERVTLKVLDFGISKMASDVDAHETSTFTTLGTPLYMSPEQIRSTKNVDARTDIWALGVILYEALTGVRPFNGTTTAAAAAIVADPPVPIGAHVDVPEGLDAVVMRALAKRAEDRFPDVTAFAEALAPFAADDEPLRQMRADRAASRRRTEPSAPSLAHAPMEARATPSVDRGAPTLTVSTDGSFSAPGPSVPHASKATGAAPTTTAGWSAQDARARRVPRRWPWVLLVAAAAAALATAAGLRTKEGASVRAPVTAGPPVEVQPVGASPAPAASASAESLPPAASPSSRAMSAPGAASASTPGASTPARPAHAPRAAAGAKGAPAAPSASAAGTTPSPTPTNPLHL